MSGCVSEWCGEGGRGAESRELVRGEEWEKKRQAIRAVLMLSESSARRR